jgi:phosphatidylserine decarboxylase
MKRQSRLAYRTTTLNKKMQSTTLKGQRDVLNYKSTLLGIARERDLVLVKVTAQIAGRIRTYVVNAAQDETALCVSSTNLK